MGDNEISNNYRSEIEHELSEIKLLQMLANVEQLENRYNVLMRNRISSHDSYFNSTDLSELHQKERTKAVTQVRPIDQFNNLLFNLIEFHKSRMSTKSQYFTIPHRFRKHMGAMICPYHSKAALVTGLIIRSQTSNDWIMKNENVSLYVLKACWTFIWVLVVLITIWIVGNKSDVTELLKQKCNVDVASYRLCLNTNCPCVYSSVHSKYLFMIHFCWSNPVTSLSIPMTHIISFVLWISGICSGFSALLWHYFDCRTQSPSTIFGFESVYSISCAYIKWNYSSDIQNCQTKAYSEAENALVIKPHSFKWWA